MIPSRLVLINFSCHERSEIDLTQFTSALIVGSVEGNDSRSNGTGKSTIFKAIEYVLFNESDETLEKFIRDDTNFCKVILYFNVEDQLYRLSRSRTRKGTSDLSFHKRTAIDADDSLIFIDDVDKDCLFWKDMASRRTSDTEKDLEKLLKLNLKIFRNTCHFVQHDFSGIATLTPEKRKSLLKEVLQLLSYSKLEKMAKDELNELSKELIRNKTILESLADPEKEIVELKNQQDNVFAEVTNKNTQLLQHNLELEKICNNITDLSNQLTSFDSQIAAYRHKELSINNEIKKINSVLTDYSSKRQALNASAKSINEELQQLKNKKIKLSEIDITQQKKLETELLEISEKILTNQINLNKFKEELAELTVPMPDDSVCKHCRQTLTEEHKQACLKQIKDRIIIIENTIVSLTSSIKEDGIKKSEITIRISQINSAIKEIDVVNNKVISLQKQLSDKKQLFDDYSKIINESKESLKNKEEELIQISNDLEKTNTDEFKKIKSNLEVSRKAKENINYIISMLNKEITSQQNISAVISHKIQQAQDNEIKKKDLTNKCFSLETEMQIYPLVIQSFSSSGIPNLIIQGVLDDWQNEANKLLSELRPGLQLSFLTEKEKDGEASDTLDIKYFLNNREREYGQLSGAQKVAVLFSLKIGLAFLLQNMFGSESKLLCLDEVDSALDKSGVDAFADIAKFFSKDFKVLVITHNDKLKDKFSHAILIEQDQNMISKARQISSW